mmetsp:Transcript_83242/g.257292  ORF Transcript_83242/g.257292 Transcript_83242/m.257292 type:complete len:215 (-) Transcript_83242:366-1010(-)
MRRQPRREPVQRVLRGGHLVEAVRPSAAQPLAARAVPRALAAAGGARPVCAGPVPLRRQDVALQPCAGLCLQPGEVFRGGSGVLRQHLLPSGELHTSLLQTLAAPAQLRLCTPRCTRLFGGLRHLAADRLQALAELPLDQLPALLEPLLLGLPLRTHLHVGQASLHGRTELPKLLFELHGLLPACISVSFLVRQGIPQRPELLDIKARLRRHRG